MATTDFANLVFSTMSDDDLTAALAEATKEVTPIFAKADSDVTVAEADRVDVLMSAMEGIEAEQKTRAEAAAEAGKRFAARKAQFSATSAEDGDGEGAEDGDGEGAEDGDAADEDPEDSDDEGANDGDGESAEDGDGEDGGDAEATVTAGANPAKQRRITMANRKTTAARKVGSKTKRPARADSEPEVVMTAAADVEGFATGQRLTGLEQVAEAIQTKVRGFAPFSRTNGETIRSQTGKEMVLEKKAAASLHVPFAKTLVASSASPDDQYATLKHAVKEHTERVEASLNTGGAGFTGTAAGWCAPSPYVYNYIADYVVDGMLSLPEVAAPRGGLQITQGPQLAQTVYGGDNVDDFGFGGTEAVAESGTYVKTCETIVCPDFEDHRLDFVGYCWKIPILTESTYPELVTDALRLSDVLYAHKMNRRFIGDLVRGSTEIDATTALGGIFDDTLEAFTQVAIKERRWWNLGENAVMEVKLPQVAKDVFKMDMSRRAGLSLDDIATDQKVAAHFANHRLAVEYVSDWQQVIGEPTVTANWPETIKGLIYPAGTWVKAVKDVINVSAVYDAASLSKNEYTGVFFEQGVMTVQMGYRSHVIEIPVCVAGRKGALDLSCAPAGSF